MEATSIIASPSLFNTRKWILISVSNLLIVAAIGVLMRYKIAYSFPYLDQKFLLHAHSHFAFAGWISQTLMVLMVSMLKNTLPPGRTGLYQKILWANLSTAVGMLVSFSLQGYGSFSIAFSTASIIVAFYFSFQFYKDLRQSEAVVQKQWFYAGMLFNLMSTLGTAALVRMMITHDIPQQNYLASVYWYLHFQYNGWFLFTCIGLFVQFAVQRLTLKAPPASVFWLFAGSCIPAYGLSVLWMNLPNLIYAIVVAASIAQFAGWIVLLKSLKKQATHLHNGIYWVCRVLLWCIAAALSIKLSLQLASVIPEVSHLAFGFRPIVIAYLHLILLAVISLFLVVYCYMDGCLVKNQQSKMAVLIFAVAIFLNEGILGLQGVASFSYTVVPYINQMLLFAALVIMLSIAMLLWSQVLRRSG